MYDKAKAVIETQILGSTRVLIGMPYEHVLDRLKTYKQHKLNISYLKSFQEIWSIRGFKGLFDGFYPNFMRACVKSYYRWPMTIFIPNTIKGYVTNPEINKIITGICIGLFESCIICPFERLKTIRMTQVKSQSYLSLMHLKIIYTGLWIQSVRQVVAWTNFLFWDHKIRYRIKGNEKQITLIQSVQIAIYTSIMNILIGIYYNQIPSVHPFDTIKTLYQMEKNELYHKKKINQVLREVYKEHGIKGLYAGWEARTIAFFLQALVTTQILDYLERTHGLAKN